MPSKDAFGKEQKLICKCQPNAKQSMCVRCAFDVREKVGCLCARTHIDVTKKAVS
jgi:hypothetical protein